MSQEAPPQATEQTVASAQIDLGDPSLYVDRELSLLAFQRRVLEEARDSANPLLERVKFLAILFANLDEFFMVRVAALKQTAGVAGASESINEQLSRIRSHVKSINEDAYSTWQEIILDLQNHGIDLRDYADLTPPQRREADQYFHQVVCPVLTPLAVDPGRPFPHISTLSLNLAVIVRDSRGVDRFARVKIPDTLAQLVPLPASEGRAQFTFIWLEQLVAANLPALFPGLRIIDVAPFRVTRDADVAIQELESDDLLETVEEAVWQRRFSAVVRLQVSRLIPPAILEQLVENLRLDQRDVSYVDGPLDLSRLRVLTQLEQPELKDPPFAPHVPAEMHPHAEDDIFTLLRREDVLLHHPFESFQPIVEFLRKAASDPDVLAIKMTLYRVGRNSPIVEALLTAIENGKQVAVMVELKARFDEESNIEWARALEAAGIHVVYGLVGIKVHSKVLLVVRREGDRIRRYIHFGTGNYNPITARLYTDLSLFTANEELGRDVTDLFNFLTGYSEIRSFRKLLVAPIDMRKQFEALIRREIEHARASGFGHLIFKMNSLEDHGMIRLLYEASQAGVKVDLVVRGICCLRPGIPGVSDNIRVRSIVGRFLEHSRIFYFANGGATQVYMGSADLMGRNLNHRVEVVVPVEQPNLIRRLRADILDVLLADNRNARIMKSDGTWTWETIANPPIDAQAQFLQSRS